MRRFAQDHLFIFYKFMNSKNSLRVLAVTARFSAKTWRKSKKFKGKIFFVYYFIHEISHSAHFGCTGKIIAILSFIQIIFTLRQISGAKKRLPPKQGRHNHWSKSFAI